MKESGDVIWENGRGRAFVAWGRIESLGGVVARHPLVLWTDGNVDLFTRARYAMGGGRQMPKVRDGSGSLMLVLVFVIGRWSDNVSLKDGLSLTERIGRDTMVG